LQSFINKHIVDLENDFVYFQLQKGSLWCFGILSFKKKKNVKKNSPHFAFDVTA
jgi:hypothetical protein